jgi:uncharacterized protein involved in type VI secretion and phage assembly
MARRVQVDIKLENGKEITHYSWLRIEQKLFSHNTFELAMPYEMLEKKGEAFFNQSHKEVCGKTITISFRPVSGSGSFEFVFKGIVCRLTLQQKGSLSNTFILSGYSATILMEDSWQRRTFLKQSFEQIAEKVLNPYANNLLKRQIKPGHRSTLRYVVQYDESNFQFICRLAATYGEWVYFTGRELIIGKPEDDKQIDFYVDGVQTFDMSVGLQPVQFSLKRYDYLHHEVYSNSSQDQSVPGLSTLGSFALQESGRLFSNSSLLVAENDVQQKNELEEAVTIAKSARANQLVQFHGKGENPDIRLGSAIAVSGSLPGKEQREEYGKYRITSIRHQVKGNGTYEHTFEALPDKTQYPPIPQGLEAPKAYPELAQVTDNQDPEKLGRVKVKFFWGGPDIQSDWIRVALPYTGAGSGMVFIPEEGAQVLVGYESGRAELPVVAGSLYHKHPDDAPPEAYTSDRNSIKALRTKAGNQILLQDKEGDKHITFTNTKSEKASIILSFEGNGSIRIATDGKLSLKGNEIELDAQTLRMKAATIEMEGQQKLEAKAAQLILKADTTAEISAQASLSLSAASLEAEGKASAKVTGATVDISGQALVKVEAALVKIN